MNNTGLVIGGVVGVAVIAFGVAWIAGRDTTPAPPPSSSSTVEGAVPPPSGQSDVQAGFGFASELLRTARTVYERERAASQQQSQTRAAAGGSTPGGVET